MAVSIFEPIGRFLQGTHLPEQVKTVDFAGLFTNPWFLVPFIAIIGYLLYKQAFRDLIILGILLGVWYASGTPYMQTLVVGDELKVSKILPVLFGGAAILGFLIYLLFGRSD
jgi:ascorbate-specific PTS system EIIC-type component UlaA